MRNIEIDLQGQTASNNGKSFENETENVINNIMKKATNDFNVINYKEYEKLQKKGTVPKEVLIKNVPYITIYNTKGRGEFLLKSKEFNLNIRIDCRSQKVSGSVDEKFPYLLENAKKAKENVLLVLNGTGARQGAIDWIKNKAKQVTDKNIVVTDLRGLKSILEHHLDKNKEQ